MKFALLGFAPDVLPLVRAIRASGAHTLELALRTGSGAGDVLAATPGTRLGDDATEALTVADLDAAIVCGRDEEALVAARRLAGTGVPLALLPDVRQDTRYAYELTLVRNDTGVPLVPLVPLAVHPRIVWVRETLFAEASSVRWLRWERDRPCDASLGFSGADWQAALLDDVAVLRRLGGDFDRVTALPTTDGAGRVVTTTVTLAGAGRPEAIWSLRAGPEPRWRLEIESGDGRWTLAGTDDPALVELAGPGGWTSLADLAPSHVDPGPALLSVLVAALDRGREPVSPAWIDTLRDFELVDGARHSIRRRRTIDLLFETTSERNQFKSQMAAGGCGVLLYCLFALVLAAALNSLGDLPVAWRRGFTLLLFLPVFAFLALQALYFVARPAERDKGPPASDER